MSMDTIERLIGQRYLSPLDATKDALLVPVKTVLIEPSLDGMEADAVAQLGFDFPLAVVSDPLTHAVLGERVEKALESLGPIIRVHLPDRPHPDMKTVDDLVVATQKAGALIAVGSGTINDLCKLAAAKQDKPCAVFATAPSMNGYTSVNAAITVGGLKKSLASVAPLGVFMDLEVLAAAPVRMIRSGLGDSVCRSTAQVDWLLSHLLLGTPYDELPFLLLEDEEPGLFGEPEALVSGDIEAMGRLARTLVLSGLGMSVCGGSQPASQGEHLISHYIEMMHPPEWEVVFHGEQIAVTTLVMARLQEQLLSDGPPVVKASSLGKADVLDHFGQAIGGACWDEVSKKQLDSGAADTLNNVLSNDWDDIRQKISTVMMPSEKILSVLQGAGAPVSFAEIGLQRDFFQTAIERAHQIRNRYTFLDLAIDSEGLRATDLI